MDKEHISVCICTYKRQHLLKSLLSRLREQETRDLFTFSVIVVDNDAGKSAFNIVETALRCERMKIIYAVENKKNIACARNTALRNADGGIIVFIDDDEFPVQGWLLKLFLTLKSYSACGCAGPVYPDLPANAPKWLLKGSFFLNADKKTGNQLDWKEIFTGNVMFRREIIDEGIIFNEELGKSGGEDSAFFKAIISKGKLFVYCREAELYEHIGPERLKVLWFLKRAFRNGGVYGKVVAGDKTIIQKTLFSIRSLFVGIFFLIVSFFVLIFGKHLFVKFLMRSLSNLGKTFGLFNILINGYA
jgi:succinoglycan biosynthesis protein ExoM